MFSFDTINVLLAFVGVITLSLGFITFLTNTENRTNRLFFFFVIAAFSWVVTMLMFRGTSSTEMAIFWSKLLYLAAASIPITFLFFSFAFTTEEEKLPKYLQVLIFLPYIGAGLISIWPFGLIEGVQLIRGQENVILFNKFLHTFYAIYIDGYFLWIYVNLFRKYFGSKGVTRTHLVYVIIGTLMSTLVGVTSNLLLPLLGNFTYNWLGQITVIFMITGIFYAIYKHKLFDTKVVTTELFVFTLWAFIIARIIFADQFIDQIIEGALLISTIFIGVALIRSVIKEVHIREKMEILATQLAEANERLTVLDRQKSEFLSIASHQLRSPLTAIKGYSSMILEGSFGKITDGKLKEAIERIFLSSERLVIIIEDFLNVSRIEQGRMQYDFSTVNLEELVEGAIEELKPNITKAGLTIEFAKGSEGPFYTHADFGKVRQMVINIIDNAVKYTPKGNISVTIERKEGRKILISVADTGIGIPRDVLPNLFQKFTRAKGAGQVNTQGTGLGLYVVKELMKAHKGHVWADSPGEGEGSTFYLEFLAE